MGPAVGIQHVVRLIQAVGPEQLVTLLPYRFGEGTSPRGA